MPVSRVRILTERENRREETLLLVLFQTRLSSSSSFPSRPFYLSPFPLSPR